MNIKRIEANTERSSSALSDHVLVLAQYPTTCCPATAAVSDNLLTASRVPVQFRVGALCRVRRTVHTEANHNTSSPVEKYDCQAGQRFGPSASQVAQGRSFLAKKSWSQSALADHPVAPAQVGSAAISVFVCCSGFFVCRSQRLSV